MKDKELFLQNKILLTIENLFSIKQDKVFDISALLAFTTKMNKKCLLFNDMNMILRLWLSNIFEVINLPVVANERKVKSFAKGLQRKIKWLKLFLWFQSIYRYLFVQVVKNTIIWFEKSRKSLRDLLFSEITHRKE